MKYQYIRAFIVLLAGLVALIVNIKTGKNVTVSLAIVLAVILVFYVIATLIVEILQHAMKENQTEIIDSPSDGDDMSSDEMVTTTEDENESLEIGFDDDEDE